MQWHVLAGATDGNSYQVAFHIPVPAANNRVGVSYQTALVNSGLGGKTVMQTGTGPGQITSAEVAQVAAGSVYEYVVTYTTAPGNNSAQDAANLNALFTAYSAAAGPVPRPLQQRLAYFGATSTS